MILRGGGGTALPLLEPVLDPAAVLELQDEADAVRAEESVLDYLMALVAATRASPLLSLGVSRAARARALADGRDFIVPDDVKALAVPALAHRVIARAAPGMAGGGLHSEAVIRALLQDLPVPR